MSGEHPGTSLQELRGNRALTLCLAISYNTAVAAHTGRVD